MDILVCIPPDREEHVRATKLNPISGLTHGFWTLSGCPRFTKPGDRVWFSIFREVFASAKILYPKNQFPAGGTREEDLPEDGRYKPAVCFDIPTVIGHEFDSPRGLPLGFRGFRYVRRSNKYVSAKRTKGLELVGAAKAKALYPKSW
jgi:hypothetical protein